MICRFTIPQNDFTENYPRTWVFSQYLGLDVQRIAQIDSKELFGIEQNLKDIAKTAKRNMELLFCE